MNIEKKHLTDEQVEKEIALLSKDPYVKLARAEERIKYKRRQYLYGLRNLKKRGMELYKQGLSIEDLNEDFEKDNDL